MLADAWAIFRTLCFVWPLRAVLFSAFMLYGLFVELPLKALRLTPRQCCRYGHVRLLKLYLWCGCPVEGFGVTEFELINEPLRELVSYAPSLLYVAAKADQLEVCRLLVSRGAKRHSDYLMGPGGEYYHPPHFSSPASVAGNRVSEYFASLDSQPAS